MLVKQADKFSKDAKELVGQHAELIKKCPEGSEVKEIIRNDLAVLQNRVTAIEYLVVDSKDAHEKMRQYVVGVASAQAKRRQGPGPGQATDSKGSGRSRLGEAPPSRTFADLITLQDPVVNC